MEFFEIPEHRSSLLNGAVSCEGDEEQTLICLASVCMSRISLIVLNLFPVVYIYGFHSYRCGLLLCEKRS